MRLTPRQKLFVAALRDNPNATQAAIRAGYSPRTAKSIASRLQRHPAVKAAVEGVEQEVFATINVEAKRVLTETARIAFASLRPLMNEDGTLKALHEIDEETLASLAVIETEERPHRRILRIRRQDKIPALALLGRHLGMFKRRIEVEGGGGVGDGEGLAEAIAAIRRSLA